MFDNQTEKLRLTRPLRVVEDSLSATGPHINLLKELNIDFIISAKPEGQVSLFAEVRNRILNGKSEEFEVLGDDKILRGYRWINGIPLNKSNPDLLINFLDYWEIREGNQFNFQQFLVSFYMLLNRNAIFLNATLVIHKNFL